MNRYLIINFDKQEPHLSSTFESKGNSEEEAFAALEGMTLEDWKATDGAGMTFNKTETGSMKLFDTDVQSIMIFRLA
jgi:hypothetical protein